MGTSESSHEKRAQVSIKSKVAGLLCSGKRECTTVATHETNPDNMMVGDISVVMAKMQWEKLCVGTATWPGRFQGCMCLALGCWASLRA